MYITYSSITLLISFKVLNTDHYHHQVLIWYLMTSIWSKCLTYINPFLPLIILWIGTILFLFNRWGNWGAGRLENLSKVMECLRSRGHFRAGSLFPGGSSLEPCAILPYYIINKYLIIFEKNIQSIMLCTYAKRYETVCTLRGFYSG